MSDGWSREELLASGEAYLEMQRKHRAGEKFVKKRYYEDLASRFGRTDKSFEYRMQNISYVMTLLGRTWLPGLKPAKNVGANVASEIEELIGLAEGRSLEPHHFNDYFKAILSKACFIANNTRKHLNDRLMARGRKEIRIRYASH